MLLMVASLILAPAAIARHHHRHHAHHHRKHHKRHRRHHHSRPPHRKLPIPPTGGSPSPGPSAPGVTNQCAGMPGSALNLAGKTYNQVGVDTFSKDASVGSFGTSSSAAVVYTGAEGMQWVEYPDGWPATYTGGAPGYEPSTVQSVHDDVMDWYLHTDAAGNPVTANPSPLPGGQQYQTYGAYSFCEKIVSGVGGLGDYYQAHLLWPQNEGAWQSAESDFPEARLDSTSFGGHAHYGGGGSQDNFDTGILDPSQWHVYTQTWGPSGRSYYMDGNLLGTSTNATYSAPERWQLQVEPSGNRNGGTGHLYVDWAWIGH